MNIENEVYFSTRLLMKDLDFDNKSLILKAFKERIEDYYFKPLRILNEKKQAFLSGMVVSSIIDIFAKYLTGEKRVEERYTRMLEKLPLAKENKDFPLKIYKNYRCGLLHEGRIKEKGEFSYSIGNSVIIEKINNKEIMMMNPKKMQEELEGYFKDYLKELKENDDIYNVFMKELKLNFGEEVELLK